VEGSELVAGVGVAVPGQQADQPPLYVVATDLVLPSAAGARDQVGGGEPGLGPGVGPPSRCWAATTPAPCRTYDRIMQDRP